MRAVMLVTLWCLSQIASAQEQRMSVPSIRVIAAADVSAKPDRADISVGVVTQAPQAREAVAQNTKQLDPVLAALHPGLRDINAGITPTVEVSEAPGQARSETRG
jgi:uncharacterized protein YggE